MATSKSAWAVCAALALSATDAAAAQAHAFSVVAGGGTMAGGAFTASDQGAVLAGPSGSRLELEPGTILRIFPAVQLLQLKPGPRTRTHTMLLTSGRLEVQVPEQAAQKDAVLVSFQRKLMAIATGGRLVAVASSTVSAVANESGEVLASWGSAFKPLEVGRLRRMLPNSEIESDVPPAPSWQASRRVWVAVHGRESIDGLTWSPVPEATRYRIELRRDGERVPFATQNTPTTQMEGSFANLEPGVYDARVRAFDAYGIGGRASAPAKLHVLGVVLPSGSLTTQDGALLLAPTQQAQFSHADGLLMSYLGATRYYPANAAVGLYRNERTVVYFRAPETDQFASVRLEPRNVRADVFIGPKTAVWPRDEVTVRVRLQHADDRPKAEGVEPVPEAKIGIDRIDLDWRKDGDELVAKVPPQRTDGPWVLRVEVKDQFGIPLGEDFLEIVGKPAPRPKAREARVRRTIVKTRG